MQCIFVSAKLGGSAYLKHIIKALLCLVCREKTGKSRVLWCVTH